MLILFQIAACFSVVVCKFTRHTVLSHAARCRACICIQAAATEALVLKYNPSWKHGNWNGLYPTQSACKSLVASTVSVIAPDHPVLTTYCS